MGGTVVIIILLAVVVPVVLIMSSLFLAMLAGQLLNDEVDARHEGSELFELTKSPY